MSDLSKPAGRGPRVLLVEDNDNDAELTKLAFAEVDSKIDLRCVGDGEQCMRALEESSASELPDLILLDLHMPRMDGLEVLRALRHDDHLKTIPTIVLTTSDAPEDINAAFRAGCSSYVKKPLGYTAFVDLVERLTRFWFGVASLPTRHGTAQSSVTESNVNLDAKVS